MKTIYYDEFKRNFFSVRSTIIVSIITVVPFIYGHYPKMFSTFQIVPSTGTFSIISGLSIFIAALVFAGIISRYVDNKSICYIVLYQSRERILFAKFISIVSYFIILIIESWVIVSIVSVKFNINFLELISTISMSIYASTIILFVSTIIKKENLAFFSGILLRIILPIFGVVGISFKKFFWS